MLNKAKNKANYWTNYANNVTHRELLWHNKSALPAWNA